jgi:hypothetical protein
MDFEINLFHGVTNLDMLYAARDAVIMDAVVETRDTTTLFLNQTRKGEWVKI